MSNRATAASCCPVQWSLFVGVSPVHVRLVVDECFDGVVAVEAGGVVQRAPEVGEVVYVRAVV